MENVFLKLDDIKEMKILDGGKIIVVKPIQHKIIVPLFCPNCEFPMKTADDSSAYRIHTCCSLCSLRFAAANEEKWQKGWRPSKEEMKEYIEDRKRLSQPLFNLK